MRIAVDAMGGDRGPKVVVQGVLDAARRSSSHYLLVGDPTILEGELNQVRPRLNNIEILPATQVIEMTEQPVEAYKSKPDASVVVGARLIKDKKADALVTIANTGAA